MQIKTVTAQTLTHNLRLQNGKNIQLLGGPGSNSHIIIT